MATLGWEPVGPLGRVHPGSPLDLGLLYQLEQYFLHISNICLLNLSLSIHLLSILDTVACPVITYEGCVSAFCDLRKTLHSMLCQSVQMLCQAAIQKQGKTRMKPNRNCPYIETLLLFLSRRIKVPVQTRSVCHNFKDYSYFQKYKRKGRLCKTQLGDATYRQKTARQH